MTRSPSETPPALHELEAEVMVELWRRERATVRETLDALNRGEKQRAYTTVMTVMVRLCEKGLLVRERVGTSDVYRPAMTRDEYLRDRSRHEVEGLVSQFGDHALAHFSRQVEQLSAQQAEALRRLADES